MPGLLGDWTVPEQESPEGLLGLPRYDTKLTPDEERQFRLWAVEQGKDPDLEAEDYDLRGFWKSGEAFAENGHGSDRWKKPNHPTFSDQSIYSTPENQGGTWAQREDGVWVFIASPTNLEYRSPDDLRAYMRRVEPGVVLKLPRKEKP